MTDQTFTCRKSMESPPIIGWWEGSQGSTVTLTEGYAHIVHRGRVLFWKTPEEQFSSRTLRRSSAKVKEVPILTDWSVVSNIQKSIAIVGILPVPIPLL